ncbi:hypothetical protein [Cupriavidus sp. SW-Y-13]|uniref:hypothetical protein n=1 Tax=Cupriavidus sp. SW-Y-13 TaxID=2653854 RepID=UPI0013664F4C|nr:hypothetical protein [Cupriavidus sp. SW-Y-13]MWL91508.1 hypothetical protein [Cupriavidus sp. SW-Y-13]
MSITADSGELSLTRRGYVRTLRVGQRIAVPAFEQVDLLLTGSLFRPTACVLALGDEEVTASAHPCIGWIDHTARMELHQIRALISGTVFQNPQETWSANRVASMMHTTPRKIRAALFAQGDALTHLCRTQRLMRALFDAFQLDLSVADLKRRVGWGADKDLEATFQDWFGVSLDTVARLRASSW